MKYRVNPSEEKRILQDILREEGISGSYSSMAALMNDTKLSITVKASVILDCLSAFILDKIVGDKDLESYEGLKSFYNQYANQDLFRAIGGISLTSSHIEELFTSSNFKENILELTVFFNVYKDAPSCNKMIESVSLGDISNSLLLMPSLYRFTGDKVQEIIESSPDTIILFAASPRTKGFLTKENFNQVYKLASNGDDAEDFMESLQEAHYDLFGTGLEVA
jgi:hypothetical protein